MATLEDEIRQWQGDWSQGGIDRAKELADLFRARGITSLADLSTITAQGMGPNASEGGNSLDGAPGPQVMNDYLRLRRGNDTTGAGDFGFLGTINQDGSVASRSATDLNPGNELGLSTQGHGTVSYRLSAGPDGKPVVTPVWQSSSDMDAVRAAALIGGSAFGAQYLQGLGGATAASGGAGAEGLGTLAAGGGGGGGTIAGFGGTTFDLGSLGSVTGAQALGGAAPEALIGTGVNGMAATGAGFYTPSLLDASTAASGLPNSSPGTPSAPNNSGSSGSPINLSDAAKLAALGLGVAGTAAAANGGGTSDADQRLLDAQTNSLTTQDDAIKRLLANSDRLLPLQEQQLRFGLDAARTGYEQNQQDRQWFLGQRNQLTGLQAKMVADAKGFNEGDRGDQLAGQASADVIRGFDTAKNSAARQLMRYGVNPNSGKFGSQIAQMGVQQALGQAGAMTNARESARKEGYALTDRAANALSGAPAAAANLTGAGVNMAASGLGLTNNALTGMNSGTLSAGQLAGQYGANATSAYSARMNAANGAPDESAAWARLIGAGLGAFSGWGK